MTSASASGPAAVLHLRPAAPPPPCAAPVPHPRAPLEGSSALRRWYERELGWATSGEQSVELTTGLRFDVLEMPADAGFGLLRRGLRTGPVAVDAAPVPDSSGAPATERRLRLLMAAGAADELPQLLDWLEWGGIALGLTALGPGGRMTAPWPSDFRGPREAAHGRTQPVWLRPPQPGCAVEPTLPAASLRCGPLAFGVGGPRAGGPGGDTEAPDLLRLVGAAATECHRARLRRATVQPFAFSYASRTVAGTRPRSLTS